jgi:hypothetical protein
MEGRSPILPGRTRAAAGSAVGRNRGLDTDLFADATATAEPPRIGYRCELRRHADPEPRQIYYDGGDYSPYCLDSLTDLLRCEARLPHSALEIQIDLSGPCPGALLREMTLRFSSLGIARLHVVIRAEGHPPIVLGAEHARARTPGEKIPARDPDGAG